MRLAAILCALLLIGVAGARPLDAADPKMPREAFDAAKRSQWQDARSLAERTGDPLLRKTIQWMWMQAPNSGAGFDDIAAFIAANPTWPRLATLQRRAEEAMSPAVPTGTVLAWFEGHQPRTADGIERMAHALLAAGRKDEATALVRRGWIDIDMSADQESRLRRAFGAMLRPQDHAARLDRLIWDERLDAAKRQILRVDRDRQQLALARIALIERAPGVDAAVARVPAHLQQDPGLIYERSRWRRRAELHDGALDLLHDRPEDLVRPEKWWIELRITIRRLLREGDARQAYRLARDHGQVQAAQRAEAEWLAGWIALRFLQESEDAFQHFKTLFESVKFPISRARGAYWAGRAAAAAGEADIARLWYATAAQHFTTFYGQVAAAALDADARPPLPPEPVPTDADRDAFNALELVRATRLAAAAGAADRTDAFIRKLADDRRLPVEWTLLGRLANEIGRHDLAIHVAKQAINDGVMLGEYGYPALPVPESAAADPTLVHAVVRQESAFAPEAISVAGARGLMQLMPATAERMAKTLRMPYSRARLTDDPEYNLQLGHAYLEQMLRRYEGSLILALAAYNAGPSRADRWLATYGPIGSSTEEALDWIESIPFEETRNYVQRVLESRTVYGSRHAGTALALTVAQFTGAPATALLP